MEQEQIHDIASFLARHAPFEGLVEEELEAIAATVARREYGPGEAALVEDGPRAEAFYVIRDGSMELVHEDEVIARPPAFCEPFTTIRHAAELMTQSGTSAILVPDGERLLMLTDADLRAKVLAGNISPENPVSRVTTPAVIVSPDHLAVDAVV